MSEVVITAIGRTPIGRAVKGSLIDQRPDDHPVGPGHRRRPVRRQAQPARRRHRPRPSVRHDRGAHPATLLNDLRTRDQTIGLETMCVGGGQGMAMIVERLS